MSEGKGEQSSDSASNRERYGVIGMLWFLSLLVVGFMSITLGMNWLGDFLHAPIGIKDNPPDPGTLIQIEQLIFAPAMTCFVVLHFLRIILKVIRS